MFFYCLFAVFHFPSVVVVMGLTQISNFRFNGLSIVCVQWIFFHFAIFPLFSLNLFLFFLVCTNLNVKWFSLCNFGNTVAPQIIKLSTENGESEEKKTAGNTNLFIELKVIEALIKVLDKQWRYARRSRCFLRTNSRVQSSHIPSSSRICCARSRRVGYSRRGSSRCSLRTAGRVRRGRREGDRRPCRRELGSSRSRAGRLKRPHNKVNSELGNRVDNRVGNRVYNVIHRVIHSLMHNWLYNKAYAGSS